MASNRKERRQEVHFRVMSLLQENSSISTREIARCVGISNGGAHYCVTALVEKGYIKLKNFSGSKNKSSYFYELTPRGMRAKAALTFEFLERKREEYHYIKEEIKKLERELDINHKARRGTL